MIKFISTIAFILSASFIFSQEFGMVELTNTLSKVAVKPTLIKSKFNNLTIKIKSDEEEIVSPSYSDSYIYFRDDKIGILVTHSDTHKEPVLLSQVKLISQKEKVQKLFFYSIEGDFVTVDYGNNTIVWVENRENVQYSYVFENLTLGSESEIQECITVFNFNHQQVSNLSINSQNLIGLSEEEVIHKYSKFYKPPLLVQQELNQKTSENDLILLFNAKEDSELQSIVIFDEHRICKYIMNYYPDDYIKSMSDIYDQLFGKPEGFVWVERSGNKTYNYFMDFIGGGEGRFIMHMKME